MTKDDLIAKPFHRINVRHLKSGNIYTFLGFGLYEPDESEVAIYQASPLLGGKIWVRPLAEFRDGGFEIHSERIPTERLGLPTTPWREGGKYDPKTSPISHRPVMLGGMEDEIDHVSDHNSG